VRETEGERGREREGQKMESWRGVGGEGGRAAGVKTEPVQTTGAALGHLRAAVVLR
jgi:hypothetical protein